MSCQIKTIGNLKDLNKVKEILSGDAVARSEPIASHELPLQDCFISLSSAGDVLALAQNTKMIILISKWDSQEPSESKNKFHIVWNGIITENQNEWITSIICLPLISLGKISAGTSPDWTCIAVGFNNGILRFYTETGALLLEQQLHNEPILGIKCQSSSFHRHSMNKQPLEELYIIYRSIICILQGFPLFTTLRACRNHLARVQAKCNDVSPATTLSYKKWEFRNQDITNDAEIIGTTSVNSFNHLMTASLCGGYNALYRSSAPQHNLVMATGKRPFIGFHYALEGGNAPVLSDVAAAMASKLVNAIGTAVPWFRSNSKTSASLDISKNNGQESTETLSCRYSISDLMREGDSIVCSPNKMLSAVTDAMGRVTLVDNKRGVAVRMWKGYRDAQCGWIEVEEIKHSGIHKSSNRNVRTSNIRNTLFLVIYAPKKGVIDIWGIQQGPKITTFTASKNGRLLYINYGLLGINETANLTKNDPQHACVFMDPLGGLKEIIVPFHFALSSKNAKKACDIYLLRKLKNFLREEDFDKEKLITEVRNVCLAMKTNEVRLQTLELLMNTKDILPDALLAAANCIDKMFDESDSNIMDSAAKVVHKLIVQLQKIIAFYIFINSSNLENTVKSVDSSDNEKSNTEILALTLLISEHEVDRILTLYKTINDIGNDNIRSESKVKFNDNERQFFNFLTCFDFGVSDLLVLQKDIKLEKKYQIAVLIFEKCMIFHETIETWKTVAANSNIQPNVFMQLALIYWMYKEDDRNLELTLTRFTQLLHAICSLNNIEEICVDYNESSLWWKDVRTVLTESLNPLHAYTAALACRAVAVTLEKYKDKTYNTTEETCDSNKNDADNNDPQAKVDKNSEKSNLIAHEEIYSSINEWENISKDTCQFTLLIGNLEDVMVLNTVVRQRPLRDPPNDFFKLPFELQNISLGMILSNGKGSVSEIVAKWLSSTGVHPAQLVDLTDIEFEQSNLEENLVPEKKIPAVNLQEDAIVSSSSPVENQTESNTNTTAQAWVLEKLSLLKHHFPYSLTSSVLLANLCWEFAMAWNKNVSKLENLDAALTVLRHIPMKHMQHGVCCLLWTLYIKKRMEASGKIMNKLGKLPKERLSIQETGLSDKQLVTFLEYCVKFFDIFSDAELLQTSTVLLKSEELWEGQSGPQPFAFSALLQTPAWYELIILHLQIANVLYMMAYFNLKISKPLNNLFEGVTHPYFFQDISDKIMFTWNHDDRKDSLRLEFLRHVITASMDFIHQETVDGKTLSSTQAVLWMSRCQTLGSMWKLNSDELRIHQACQLYINGFDRLAEEVVGAVNDTDKLASDLLPIAGRRMMAYLSKSPDLLEEVSRISTTLHKYLESLNMSELILTNCSNNDTIELIHKVSRYLPDTHCEFHVIQRMLDATFIFQDKT
ncbi:PREDICTED: rab3 GTPase-activating protein non-catalytic subunit [Polistes canadensis]|uniref:rab3 GTPase-activating protein non-catalytic subunit n=1 Tax=Polistes canadensis TaxID=91411 RepID=UPI000718CBED|nr:PREDICTED: rab3 GTPase-activating protein non-catalytic subunit [Polistes canadensis]